MLGWLRWLGRVGVDPTDDEETRLHKAMLVYASTGIATLAILWSGVYLAAGERTAAAIPGSYSAFSFLSLVVFARFGRFSQFRTSQLVLILVLPIALCIQLGGLVASSGVVVWAQLAPLGALIWSDRKSVWAWLGAYLAGVVLCAGWSFAGWDNGLEPWLRVGMAAMNLVGVSLLTLALLALFVGERDAARQKSETLLANLLPASIVARLREPGAQVADHHAEVSILFADIVGFTVLSERIPPGEMVALLDEVFTAFDDLVLRHGAEKIRTIGDSYMVATGVPTARSDHAEALVDLGLAMLAYMHSRSWPDGAALDVRIGINSGPVVAGVLGRARLQYDIWGDAVNVASRMESHGVPGRVQIGASTHILVGPHFACTTRGRIEIKGKGELEAWLVDGRA